MALVVQSSIPGSSPVRLSFSNSMPTQSKNMSQVAVPKVKGWRKESCRRRRVVLVRAMVQEEASVQGSSPSSVYARDMERLSAKESLLLAVNKNFSHPFKLLHLMC